jgi:hypothetical protein
MLAEVGKMSEKRARHPANLQAFLLNHAVATLFRKNPKAKPPDFVWTLLALAGFKDAYVGPEKIAARTGLKLVTVWRHLRILTNALQVPGGGPLPPLYFTEWRQSKNGTKAIRHRVPNEAGWEALIKLLIARTDAGGQAAADHAAAVLTGRRERMARLREQMAGRREVVKRGKAAMDRRRRRGRQEVEADA